jgi:hypothetical protein
MLRLRVLSVATAVLLSLAGCGGSGGGSSSRSLTKQQMLAILERGVTRGLAMRDSQGGLRPRRAPEPGLVFDETLDLWVQHLEGDPEDLTVPSGEKYFVDEAGQIDGGFSYLWNSAPNVFPNVIRMEAKYLAGNLAGVEQAIRLEFNEDESASLTSHNVYPHEGTMDYTGSWANTGLGQWQGKFTLLDESWEKYTFVKDAEGGPDFTIESSTGVTYTFHFAEDGSGTGTITGSGELLPAQIVWDAQGQGVVTWSDSSTSEIYVEPMI